MKRLILDAMSEDWYGEEMIKEIFKESEVTYFRLRDHEIKPCLSCDGCWGGKCVHKDIMDDILRGYANSDEIYFVTPIRFGSYSTLLKKAIDRILPIASALYKVKGGYMIHPCRYPNKRLVGIGQQVMGQEGEVESFRKIIEHNARNFECTKVKAISFKDEEELKRVLSKHKQCGEEDWTWVFKK